MFLHSSGISHKYELIALLIIQIYCSACEKCFDGINHVIIATVQSERMPQKQLHWNITQHELILHDQVFHLSLLFLYMASSLLCSNPKNNIIMTFRYLHQ